MTVVLIERSRSMVQMTSAVTLSRPVVGSSECAIHMVSYERAGVTTQASACKKGPH
jgi:hypothetical protein